MKKFEEVEIGKRMLEERIERNGYERRGRKYELRGGIILERGEKLKGEIEEGYMKEERDDKRIENIRGK